jgi:hypothetical protein
MASQQLNTILIRPDD